MTETETILKLLEDPDSDNVKMFYYGPIGRCGHYLWRSDRDNTERGEAYHPWGRWIDGSLPPQDNDKEGNALIHHKDGWTALSFWDRTVDKRGGSHSTYIINKILNYDEMVALAQETFPERWAIMNFEVLAYVRGVVMDYFTRSPPLSTDPNGCIKPQKTEACDYCKGLGDYGEDRRKCEACHGLGYQEVRKEKP